MTNFELNKVTCRIIKSEYIEMIIHSFITKNLILMGLLVSLLGCHSGSAEVIYQNAQYKNMHLDIFKISDFRQLKLFLNDQNQQPYGYFKNVQKDLNACQSLVFAMNAGMYHPNYQPVGLYIENAQQLKALNTEKGFGNFFMQPNGVLAWNSKNAVIATTDELQSSKEFKNLNPLYATQSGPMLVSHGQVNATFQKNAQSRKIRNGVGIKNQTLYFVISREPINFYDFAQVFKTQLKIDNALYLDGTISSAYHPKLDSPKQHFKLGPMVGWVNNENCAH